MVEKLESGIRRVVELTRREGRGEETESDRLREGREERGSRLQR